jgi:OOP family OmpA-OmpF porin
MIKKSLLLTAMLGLSAAALAQTSGIDLKGTVGYAIDQRGEVVRSGTGLCWRTGYWTPAMAIEACDPDLVKKLLPPPLPPPLRLPLPLPPLHPSPPPRR